MAFRLIKDIWANLRQIADRDIWQIADAGTPTSGSSGTGAGFAGLGSTYVNTSTGIKYINTGTKASPTWSVLATGSIPSGGTIVGSGTITAITNATTHTVAFAGALTTDIVVAQWRVAATVTTSMIVASTATTAQVSIVTNTNPGASGVFAYAIIR